MDTGFVDGFIGMKHFIYSLSDPRDGAIRYVGFTRNLARRRREHRRLGRRHTCFEWAAELRRADLEPVMEVLEECDFDNRGDREIFWIAEMHRRGEPLLNRSGGGDGAARTVVLESTRRKLSRASRGRPKPEGFGARLSAVTKGRPHSWTPEGRARASATQFKPGRAGDAMISEEGKRIRAEKLRAYWDSFSEEERFRINSANRRAWWSKFSDEERSDFGRRIAEIRALDPEKVAAAARKAAPAKSAASKAWWASMTAEERSAIAKERAAKRYADPVRKAEIIAKANASRAATHARRKAKQTTL